MIQSLIREREITRNEVGFNFAYLVASIAIIALIILYTFLYTILQFQDYALLIGSIGFFVVIALTMYLSRKIDWYGVIKED